MSDVTEILGRIEEGDGQAAERLLPLVYDELRKLAKRAVCRYVSASVRQCVGTSVRQSHRDLKWETQLSTSVVQ